jgi:hypothetical protein
MEITEKLKDAVLILRKYQDWRRGYDVRSMKGAGVDNKELGNAIDAILEHFGYSEPLAQCLFCKHNVGIGCRRDKDNWDNPECKFEEA